MIDQREEGVSRHLPTQHHQRQAAIITQSLERRSRPFGFRRNMAPSVKYSAVCLALRYDVARWILKNGMHDGLCSGTRFIPLGLHITRIAEEGQLRGSGGKDQSRALHWGLTRTAGIAVNGARSQIWARRRVSWSRLHARRGRQLLHSTWTVPFRGTDLPPPNNQAPRGSRHARLAAGRVRGCLERRRAMMESTAPPQHRHHHHRPYHIRLPVSCKT